MSDFWQGFAFGMGASGAITLAFLVWLFKPR